MSLFRTIVFAAALAGLIGGGLLTLLQQVGTVPLILQAEVLEHADAPVAPAPAPAAVGHEHHHDSSAWAPQDGLERTGFTLLTNIVSAVGFALLLVAGFALSGRGVEWREGLLWGIGGFIVFALAPSLGLPPELPGAMAAPLAERQTWWAGTAAATAAGLALVAFRREPLAVIAGLGLIVLPHLIGAPQAEVGHEHGDLLAAHRFVVAVLVTSFLFWAALGVLSAVCFSRFNTAREPVRAH